MNSYFYADSIAKQLAAAPDNDVKAQGMMSQNHKTRHFHSKNLLIFHFLKKVVRSSKLLMSAEIMPMLLDIK